MNLKTTIYVPQEVEIPGKELLSLAAAVRENWSMPDGTPIHIEDLLVEARKRKLVQLPDQYKTENAVYSDEDLKEIGETA